MAEFYKLFSVKDKNKEEINNYLKTTGVWIGYTPDGDKLGIYDVDEDNFNKVVETLINEFKLEVINFPFRV